MPVFNRFVPVSVVGIEAGICLRTSYAQGIAVLIHATFGPAGCGCGPRQSVGPLCSGNSAIGPVVFEANS